MKENDDQGEDDWGYRADSTKGKLLWWGRHGFGNKPFRVDRLLGAIEKVFQPKP